jgi:hypothetical protein
VAGEGASIGEVHIDVSARALNFWNSFVAQTRGQASKVGDDLGAAAGKALADRIGRSISDGIDKGSRDAQAKAAKAGEESGGKFADTFKKRVEAALKSLPDAKITADSSDADIKIAALRAELADLSSKKVGVDIDDALAVAQLDRIREELDRLGAESPNVQVKVDTAAAAAELSKVTAEAERVAALSPTIQVDADTGAATAQLAALGGEASITGGGFQGLIAAGIALGPAIVPAAAAATGAIGALGAVAFAAGAAIGVAALAIVPVIAAVKAMSDAEGQAGQAASTGASRQLQMASAIDQVRSARAALANTTANAADSERRASEQVTTAERNLATAQQAALTAQRAINDAREAARRSLESLNNQVADNAIAQRRANLDLVDAQAQLDAVRANPAATARQREEAQIAFDQAKQQVLELGQRQRELTADADKANRAGVEGSTQVVAAKQNEIAAQQKVADAQRAVADARAAQDAQARQSAFAIAQAQQSVVAAQRAVQQASISAGNEGSAAANKLATAMAALSPAGQAFATFLYGLKPIFTDLSKAAQDGFLPGLQAGIQALLPIMPQVTEFVRRLAGVMGELARQALTALASPFWQNFFTQMAQIALPLLEQMGPLFLNVAQAFASLFLAFAPFAPKIIGWLGDLAARFAAWAATLDTNAGFQAFLKYITDNAPLVAQLVGDLAVTFTKLLIALAPLGQLVLEGLVKVFDWLSKQDPGTLIAIAAGIGAIVAGIVLLVGGPISAIVAGIVVIGGALVYAYTHFAAFRDIVNTAWNSVILPAFQAWWTWEQILWAAGVTLWNTLQTVWNGITTVISFAWNNIIKPVFDAISFVVSQVLAPLFLWLWQHVIAPVWDGIKVAIEIAWALIRIVFGLIEIYIKAVLAPIFTWLWHNVIEPVWHGISDTISFVWNNLVKPVLDAVGGFIHDHVAPAFKTGVDAIGKAWDGLRDAARVPIAFVVNQIVNPLIRGYNDLADIFHVGKVGEIKGFATGGFISGPGGPRDDAILARLSAGEYIIPAHIVATWGIDFFDRLIGRRGVPGVTRPGDGSQGIALPGFADGGLVGFFKDAWAVISDPVKLIKKPIDAAISRIPGAGTLVTLIANMGHRLVDGLLGWIHGVSGGSAPGDIGKAQAFVKAQAGKPYGWAMAGPGSYDCSGIVSAAYLVAHGKNPYNHLFSTSNEAGYFPLAGRGVFTAGWANPGERGGGSVGHTAANIAGLAFESVGSQGVRIGAPVTPLTSFAHLGHYDSGGVLPPGLTIARNDTGRDEYVFTGDQMRALGGRSGRGDITIPVYGSTASPAEIAAMVKHELAWELR